MLLCLSLTFIALKCVFINCFLWFILFVTFYSAKQIQFLAKNRKINLLNPEIILALFISKIFILLTNNPFIFSFIKLMKLSVTNLFLFARIIRWSSCKASAPFDFWSSQHNDSWTKLNRVWDLSRVASQLAAGIKHNVKKVLH